MNYIVPVSEEERAAGQLSKDSAATAYSAMTMLGFVILRGAYAVATVEEMHREFQAQYGALDLAGMQERAGKAGPVMEVGSSRFEIVLRLTGAFDTRTFANPLLLRFLIPLMGLDMRLSSFTAVASYPGAEQQHTHRDTAQLFPEFGVGPNLPTYAVNVAVPLVDVDEEVGPTGIWPGTHRMNGTQADLEKQLTVPFKRGDAVLIDYRTLHAGRPNASAIVRPILYLVYARQWFFDDFNHFQRLPLDMPEENYDALPNDLKPLLLRVYSQIMRARMLTRRQS